MVIQILIKMNNTINNNTLVQRMNLFLDSQLSKTEELELLKEIKTNSSLKQLIEKEQHFRDFVKSRVQRKKPSSHLISSLKEKISGLEF